MKKFLIVLVVLFASSSALFAASDAWGLRLDIVDYVPISVSGDWNLSDKSSNLSVGNAVEVRIGCKYFFVAPNFKISYSRTKASDGGVANDLSIIPIVKAGGRVDFTDMLALDFYGGIGGDFLSSYLPSNTFKSSGLAWLAGLDLNVKTSDLLSILVGANVTGSKLKQSEADTEAKNMLYFETFLGLGFSII